MATPPVSTGISIDAAKSAGPKMMVSRRGDAAQISSTLISPPVVSIWASIPMWPTGSPQLRLDLGHQEVEGDHLGRVCDLGQHELVESLAGVRDDVDDVAVGPLGVPGVDPNAEHPVVPGEVLDRVGHLGPGRLLLRAGATESSRSRKLMSAGTVGALARKRSFDPGVDMQERRGR